MQKVRVKISQSLIWLGISPYYRCPNHSTSPWNIRATCWLLSNRFLSRHRFNPNVSVNSCKKSTSWIQSAMIDALQSINSSNLILTQIDRGAAMFYEAILAGLIMNEICFMLTKIYLFLMETFVMTEIWFMNPTHQFIFVH